MKQIEQCINEQKLRKTDEAWIVVDKDSWTDQQLTDLFNWSRKADNYGFALSNPKFEYWLILHFEEGDNIKSSRDFEERLKTHLPDYDKDIDIDKFKKNASISDAIRRAKNRDTPPCSDWPKAIGSTTVYKLVESITKSQSF